MTEEDLNQQRGTPETEVTQWGISQGMPVVGADTKEIGQVKDVRRSDFLVDRPLARDVYVPMDAVQRVSNDEVVLSVASEDVDQMGWASSEMPGLDGPPPPTDVVR
jgi:hypothetical protein